MYSSGASSLAARSCRLRTSLSSRSPLRPRGAGRRSRRRPRRTPTTRSDEAFAKGVALHQAGDIIGAIDAYEQALKLTPGRVDARSNLGAALVRSAASRRPSSSTARRSRPTPARSPSASTSAWPSTSRAVDRGRGRSSSRCSTATPSRSSALLLLADCQLQMGNDAQVVELLSPREAELGDDRLYAYLLGTALIRRNEAAPRPGHDRPPVPRRRDGRGPPAAGHPAHAARPTRARRCPSCSGRPSSTRTCPPSTRSSASRS